MNQVMTVEVADFVEAVDAELADLPADVRAELLEDLPGHLADVLADGGTPYERLGEPVAYAAELRAAAGYPRARATAGRQFDLAGRLEKADVRIGNAIGYARVSDFAKALRPAWWIVRAYLVVQLITGAHGRTGAAALMPLVGGNVIFGVVALVAACAVSIWLGRRATGRWAFTASALVTFALLFYAAVIVQYATRGDTGYVGTDSGYVDPLDGVTNIYPVGPDGTQLSGVRLYDQSGNPISVPSDCSYDPSPGVDQSAGQSSDQSQLYPISCSNPPGPFPSGTRLAPVPGAAADTTTATATPRATQPAAATPTTTPSR